MEILQRPGRYVFVGTPCMIEGLAKLQAMFPVLKERIVLTVGLVCAGMASRLSTRSYIEKDGHVNIQNVALIQYRGGGWPGRFRVFAEDGKLLMDRPLIGGSLVHVVGKDHYLRCENCLDHWGHFADIVVSDPWTPEMVNTEKKGWSAVMIRTDRGKHAFDSVAASGALEVSTIDVAQMLAFNRHLCMAPAHLRHSWMALYQLIVRHRWRWLGDVLYRAIRGRLVGIRTTLRARYAEPYYY